MKQISIREFAGTVVFLLYFAAIVYAASNHEMGRDEIRALSISSQSQSIVDLFSRLRNEGHPALWYLLLYGMYNVFGSSYILPVLSIGIATAAVLIFLLKAPFPLWQKGLFVFGQFPIFQYSVICRSYGLSMLLLFALASLYKERQRHILSIGVILFLMGQTNLPSLIVSIAFLTSIVYEALRRMIQSHTRPSLKWAISVGFIVGGIFLSLLQIIPDAESSVFHSEALTIHSLGKALASVLLNPGRYFYNAFVAYSFVIILSLVIWIYWIIYLKKFGMWIILMASSVGIGMSFDVIYPGSSWHQGVFFLVWITVLWLDQENAFSTDKGLTCMAGLSDAKIFHRVKLTMFVGILCLQLIAGGYRYWRDWSQEVSSSKAFAGYLTSRPETAEAILIGEPDFNLEALPYYVNNRIYIPRECRFSKYTHFTKASKDTLTLNELLVAAAIVQEREHHPVLIALGHELDENQLGTIRYGYSKVFSYSPTDVKNFRARTKMIGIFRRALSSDENYDLYQLR